MNSSTDTYKTACSEEAHQLFQRGMPVTWQELPSHIQEWLQNTTNANKVFLTILCIPLAFIALYCLSGAVSAILTMVRTRFAEGVGLFLSSAVFSFLLIYLFIYKLIFLHTIRPGFLTGMVVKQAQEGQPVIRSTSSVPISKVDRRKGTARTNWYREFFYMTVEGVGRFEIASQVYREIDLNVPCTATVVMCCAESEKFGSYVRILDVIPNGTEWGSRDYSGEDAFSYVGYGHRKQ